MEDDGIFGTMDLGAMLSEIEQEDKAGKGQSLYWKPKNEGITKIRFIPPLQKLFGEKIPYERHRVHYINSKMYFCLNQTLKDKDGNIHEACACPICQKSKQIYDSSERGTEDWQTAGDLRAKDRFVSRVIIRGKTDSDGKDAESVPEFYEFGKKIRDLIVAATRSREYGNPFDLKNGRDFSLSKRGTGKNTDYSGSMFSGNQSAIFTSGDVRGKVADLFERLKTMSYSQLVSFESYDVLAAALKDYLNGGSSEAESPADSGITDDMVYGGASKAPAAVEEKKAEESPEDDIDALLNSI